MIEPIGPRQQREVQAATARCIAQASRKLGRPLAAIPVHFDLSGRSAGMFCIRGRDCWIRYNPWIFGKYYAENLADTVPHEVAHYVVHCLYGLRRVAAHGPEWQQVMRLLGASPQATFNRDLDGVPQRRQRTHRYVCGCRHHTLSSTRHNRVQRGTGRYQCRHCGETLVYSG
ncbi:MAG: SprT-like domain-containing protein [Parahaliea sp.]